MINHDMKKITDLSFKLLSHICEYISIRDVLNLSATCKQLKDLINNNSIWKRKFIQRWPSLRKTYTKYLGKKNIVMKEEVIKGLKCEKALLSCLSLMPYTDEIPLQPRHCCKIDEFNSLFYPEGNVYLLRYYYFHNKLTKIMKLNPRNRRTNLTHIHYADMLLKYVIKCYVKKKWQTLMNVEPQQKIVEKTAFIVSQWYQPNKYLFYSHVTDSLNNIAEQILKLLYNLYPRHPIFMMSKKELAFWRNNNISDNQWDKLETRQILDVLCRVIFHELQFQADLEQGYTEPQFFFIDQVLEKRRGHPLCLAVIIQAIARRLGVRCEIMTLGSRLFLNWMDNYKIDFKDENCYFIDIYEDGLIRRRTEYYYYIYPDIFVPLKESVLTIMQVALRIHEKLANIYSDNLDDEHFGGLWNILTADIISDANITKNNSNKEKDINSETNIISTMNSLKENIESMHIPAYVHQRGAEHNMNYTVGMLVKYEKYFWEKGVGVIIGWHYSTDIKHCCNQTSKKILTQPCYHILACNNEEIHVDESHIEPVDMLYRIDHPNIGQYFSHFNGTHYISNEVHQKYFPEDMAILLEDRAKRRLNGSKKMRDCKIS